jgi:hypothetical protein
MPDSALKALASSCRGCGIEIPAQPSGPGRPRVFCSVLCRRRYHHVLEQAKIERERAEADERKRFETDRRIYGVREARRRAKERASRIGARS